MSEYPKNISGESIFSQSLLNSNKLFNWITAEGKLPEKKERFFYSRDNYHIVRHSDYFMDFVNEEFGGMDGLLNFKKCLYVYEMYNDVVSPQIALNFKRRFKLEKRKFNGFSN